MSSETRPLLGDAASSKTYNDAPNLLKFRRAIGINSDPQIADNDYDLEAARNSAKGLYKQVIQLQRFRNRQHRAFEVLFYSAFGAQIVIGAVLTALGPVAENHSVAITILGVFNTSIAGLLTVLKGQGLPDRFRKDEYQMKKVQDLIEEMDSRLSLEGADQFTAQELDEVVQQIWDKYNSAVDTAEMNKPNSYTTQNGGSTRAKDKDGNKTDTKYSAPTEDGSGDGKGKMLID